MTQHIMLCGRGEVWGEVKQVLAIVERKPGLFVSYDTILNIQNKSAQSSSLDQTNNNLLHFLLGNQ